MPGRSESNAAARRSAWRNIHITCACGREVYGNGKSHFRACTVSLESDGWPLDESMRHALREEGYRSATIRAVERGLGRIYLDRRASGDKTALRWAEYRDTVWRLAEENA